MDIRIRRRGLAWLLGGMLLTMGAASAARAQDDPSLAFYRQAKINWRQATGQSLRA